MKRLFIMAFIGLLPAAAAQASLFGDDAGQNCASGTGVTFETGFSSPGTLSPVIVNEIASAVKSIRVVAHGFTSKPVSEALLKASRAGRDVKIVLDEQSNKGIGSAAKFLVTMNLVPHTAKDAVNADYIIIDDKDVVLGTVAGLTDEEEEQKTAGSVVVIHNAADLAKQYIGQFQALWDSSQAMKQDKN